MSMPQSQPREGPYNPTSPHSSSGAVDAADSFKGTPDTRITVFSPEDGSTKSARVPHSLSLGSREPGPIKFPVTSPASVDRLKPKSYFHMTSSSSDPFVTSQPTSRPIQKLSPTASCFSPFSTPIARGSVSDNTFGVVPEIKSEPEADQSSTAKPLNTPFVHSTLSTDLGLSRCLVVTVPGQRVEGAVIDHYINDLEILGFKFLGTRQLFFHADRAYIRFVNIRDACLFSQNSRMGGREWTTNYISPRLFSQIVDPTSGGMITDHEAQLSLAVFPTPTSQPTDHEILLTFVQNILLVEADLFALKYQASGVEGSIFNAIVEFCDNDASLKAVSKISRTVIDGFQICMALYRPDIPNMSTILHDGVVSPARTITSVSDLSGDFQRMSISRLPSTVSPASSAFISTPTRACSEPPFHMQQHLQQHSYGMMPVMCHGMHHGPQYMLEQYPQSRGHGALYSTGNYSLVGPVYPPSPIMSLEYMTPRQYFPRSDGRRQHAMRITRAPYHNVTGQHNHVDVNRIREGIDVRTTIMLRNIPNKVDQAMLKRIVDESSWGKYDFMYLRIDFANDCNVGYAFINFVDPLDIIDFVNARGNQRWNCFKSDKVAEISYATIQGKDCLVQKFRNSSVMLEAPHYRPKLYFTSNGPVPEYAGQEEPFPEPDNQSKMKRSCENAEHVGLFTPNAGQHFRDEQRRRRSQYDRGTRLAALEEYDYESSFHPYSPQ